MCGINGIIGLTDQQYAKEKVGAMNDALQHRGPNDAGMFVEGQIALGHRRLSIIDLSSAGHQPMVSHDGRYVVVFNGEIYNYQELKKELDYPFKTGSDTEVILAAFSRWGRDCVHYFNGMFAFALYDTTEKTLWIFRDRLGIKPLYFFHENNVLIFSSEVRALLASGLVPRKMRQESLVEYLRYQTVHAPHTMLQGVQMLMPGHFMEVKLGEKIEVKNIPYWQLSSNKFNLENVSKETIQKEIKKRLYDAVEARLVADVPFGAFLSGGIDSSVVVGIMAEVSIKPVHTFNISFAEEEFSEAKYARQIADRFNTEHHEIKLRPEDFLALLPEAMEAMDHPSGDGPNTYVVSKATKEAGITMALTGLGGDELFAGYSIFKRMHRLQKMQWVWQVPHLVRKLGGNTLYRLKPNVAVQKIRELLDEPVYDFTSIYRYSRRVLGEDQIERLLFQHNLPEDEVLYAVGFEKSLSNSNVLTAVSQAEIATYMQNVLLRDTDQMSMAHALELRVPFLDYRLVEYVLSVPERFKYPTYPKQLLIESLPDLLPNGIVNRPKMGFTLPWEQWLRNELHGFAENQINHLAEQDVFDGSQLKELWKKFNIGDKTVTFSRIWPLIVLSYWMERNEVALS